MNIDHKVLDVIGRATVEGTHLYLSGQLDRDTYVKTDKVLKAAGGKWNRKAGAHVFERCAEDRIQQMLVTRSVIVPQDFGYFPTPKPVVELLLDLADLEDGQKVLEPSAGRGNIALPVAEITGSVSCVELLEDNCEALEMALADASVKATVVRGDFLKMTPPEFPVYDRVVMNPPFEKQADIRHVFHAFKYLKDGGKLVAVMSASVMFRDNNLTREFRDFVNRRGGVIQELPAGSFKVSGTNVNTVVVTIPN